MWEIESDCYNRLVVDKLRDKSKYEINTICEKYNLDQEILRQIVNLEFDLDLYCALKVNRILDNYDFHGN